MIFVYLNKKSSVFDIINLQKNHTNTEDSVMRKTHTTQPSLLESYSQHKFGAELEMISQLLDEHQEALLDLMQQDLIDSQTKAVGRHGLTVDSILRCLILKQRMKVSYENLAFYLSDSMSCFSFARLDGNVMPKKSCLQASMRKVTPSTLEAINEFLLLAWYQDGFVDPEKIRVDATVTSSNIVPPSDSQLLNDSVRVLSRLLKKSQQPTGIKIQFEDQRAAAKSLAFRIFNAKKAEKDRLYPELLAITVTVLQQVDDALEKIQTWSTSDATLQWVEKITHYKELAKKVIHQTQVRVIDQKHIPSSEKIVSIFEPHTDVIVKGKRDVQFGHKINLSTEVEGFITYLRIEKGNPADSTLLMPVAEHHNKIFGPILKTMVSDGCYASQANVKNIRGMEKIQQVVFSKPVGLSMHDMGVKKKTFAKIKRFRAGVEANISEFKRAYGAGKATWKGLDGFEAYIRSSVLSYNLFKMARLRI